MWVRFSIIARFVVLALLCWNCLGGSEVQAQTVNQYTVNGTASDTITDSTNCTTQVSKSFTVPASYVISDVDFGVLLSHTYRSDLRITLIAPNGDTAIMMEGIGGAADNLNVRFNDEAASAIATHTSNDNTGTAPYQRTFRPGEALTIFDGDNAAGTWTMIICDFVAQDTGLFLRADLYITSAPANYVDLSVGLTLAGGNNNVGDTVSYTLTVNNASGANLNATGVTVRNLLPAGLSFVSATGFGSYNSGTGDWTVGSVPIGTTRTLTINATITAGGGTTITSIAQVTAQGQTDLDSTPNNGVTTEDDYRAVSFTVGTRSAGFPPTLTCPNGSTLLDWNNHSWTSGSSTGSATLPNIGTVSFNVSTQGSYSAPLALTSDNTGGFGGGQLSLFQSIEYTTRNQITTTVVTLPVAVPGVQFRILDVDFAANDFADMLTVTGSNGGTPVTPTLTNGVANYVSGNVAIGDAASGGTSANGNVVITFSSPVNSITIVYGNHTTAPADPDGQAISIYDFNFCNPTATLTVSKISEVLNDYVSGSNHKYLPGAMVRYCITVGNNGPGTATTIAVDDTLPADVTYVPGSMTSGTSCGTATTVEDDDASDGTETDTVRMSITGSTVSGSAATLAANASIALVLLAIID